MLQVLAFFVFIATVAAATSAFGYGLSLLKERTVTRRCRMPHGVHHRRTARRQRIRCRYEG